jgi:fructokinase
MRVVSIGEILWDVIGANEYLGGAPFNLCAHLVRLGHEAHFVSTVGDDARGRRARQQLGGLGIDNQYLGVTSEAPTGISEIVLDSSGKATHSLPRPAAYDFVSLTTKQRKRLADSKPDWLAYGTLLQMRPRGLELTRNLIGDNPGAKRFYDVNLRPHCWTPDLVSELLSVADAVKMNDEEAQLLSGLFDLPGTPLQTFCKTLTGRMPVTTVCVTRGTEGCALWHQGEYVETSGFPVEVDDTVGAGDAFAAALLHGFSQQWSLTSTAEFANRVGALVASRPGATPEWTVDEAMGLLKS